MTVTTERQSGYAAALMAEFVSQTGLLGDKPARRYLWTDAFAVCNLIGLARATDNRTLRDNAVTLVDQVHQVLGRHRPDDPRDGWISGLSEAEGARHPTAGGLRIGKPEPERGPDEPFHADREWQRDGQYFHYLTKWMHALHVMAGATGDARYQDWARELAAVAHEHFTFNVADGGRRMVWKMSIDLSRPQVPSSGQHDPLDGLITYLEIYTGDANAPARAVLDRPLAEADALTEQLSLTTPDPLGIGGLLTDAARLARLTFARGANRRNLLDRLLRESAACLHYFADTFSVDEPAGVRLAFRELGLAIGLRAIELTEPLIAADPDLRRLWADILSYRELGANIIEFWSRPASRESLPWKEHKYINKVMLATSLAPAGFVEL